MEMKTVNVAELKAKLSHYLGEVKEGQTLYVTSHHQPVAELKPIDSTTALKIISPANPLSVLSQVQSLHLPEVDAASELRKDRDRR
jgi:prevent-host-death family protein